MAKKRLSGLDELMIVNPGVPNRERDLRLSHVFLGEDGTLYQVQGLQEQESLGQVDEFYLGEDGTLYRLSVAKNPDHRYFLGEDGTLYRVIT